MIRSRVNRLHVKAVPGCTTGTDRRCLHCRKHRKDAPLETLSHIRGQCEQVKDMRSYRHDEVVKVIARELRKEDKWKVTVEERTVEGLKPDLIIRMKDKTKAWIIGPTVRMETTVTDIRAHNEENEMKEQRNK
ncbi:hypothetical protein RvY_18808 [Ramazzottius varieornatus]|uniref:Uncharacterized protein n=1 Tax=Ramazzottius varieornatus TaxID=947166 RepID=A0A1D1WB59_RAMVA|nr:hypothetical protein RvY_18808 [Ramazzottius varieornatus]